MLPTALLTSFDIWKPHHVTNASDDLLQALMAQKRMPAQTHLLRKIPVDFQVAPETVIAAIDALEPDLIVCCGMAETRSLLTVETNGQHETEVIGTRIDVETLVQDLAFTTVSEDAGPFVCNYLYYSVLKYLQAQRSTSHCIFVHVPVLTETNVMQVMNDFLVILQRLQWMEQINTAAEDGIKQC